jgi:DNA-binding transcriptional regulator YhcF (GntR family)
VAAAFGISPQAVRQAIRKGRVDQIGLPPHVTRFRHGPEPFSVRIRGELYPSVNAAAEALGVSPVTVRNAIRRGREDFIGIGQSRKHSTASVGRVPGNARAVQIGAQKFPSIKHVARFAGIGYTTVRDHLKAGNVAALIAHVMRAQAAREGHRKKLPDAVHGSKKDPRVFRLGYERREAAA